MNLKRCENGHFYDADKFVSCPHCAGGNGSGSDVTVGVNSAGSDVMPTVPEPSLVAQIPPRTSPSVNPANELENLLTVPDTTLSGFTADEEKTISIYPNIQGVDPVVGWLVAVKGPHYGESFKLKSGRNFIGRDKSMDVVLVKDTSVSRVKHAIILYEPKRREFLAQCGESKELFYLNDEVVLSAAKLKERDILTIGNTTLMFLPLCGELFSWEDYKNE